METQVNSNTSGLTAPMFAAFNAEKEISFIRGYDPKATITEGYRHAVIRYRETAKTVAKPAQMVTVPQLKLSDEYLMPQAAVTVLLGVLEDEQDALIKQAIEEGKSLINWADISLDTCLTALTATRVSSRLTKEQIEQWVMVAMQEHLRSRGKQNAAAKGFAEGSEGELKQVAATINTYRELFGRLAAPVPNLGQEQATALSNQLKVSNLDDDIAKALSKRLHAILNPVAANTGDL